MPHHYISDLAALDESDATGFGRKACTLGALTRAGYDVPAGFALSTEVSEDFLSYNSFPYPPADYAAFTSEIRESITNYRFHPEVLRLLATRCEALLAGQPESSLIVRTSTLCEDSVSSSMAGVFRSFAGLR